MKKALLTLFKFIATGAVSLVLAACYGPSALYKRISVRTAEGEAVPGLKVTLSVDGKRQAQPEMTDREGLVDLAVPSYLTGDVRALIEDVDGRANGGEFKPREVAIAADRGYEAIVERK